jgi:1,2-diacylglycerol 3-beta-glucosyltransferase
VDWRLAVTLAFAVIIAIPALYLAFLAAVTLLAPPVDVTSASPGTTAPRFAVLVPAHDEEMLIGRTVAGLLALSYPTDRFAVHVVADNCGDATAAVARRQGACVHERDEPGRRGKGAALNWLVAEVAREAPDTDALVVVDADSELSPDFLAVMARYVTSGSQVVQSLNLVDVSDDRPLVRFRELAFQLTCHLRPLAYRILGGSSCLYGNGMCLGATITQRYRWSESSVVEDGELFIRLVRDGHRVVLARDATVRSVMPGTMRAAGSQSVRWERARFEFVRDAFRLLWQGLRQADPNPFFAGLTILHPSVAVLTAGGVLGVTAGLAIGAPALVALALASLLCLVVYVQRGASLGGMPPAVIGRLLLWAPVYAAWRFRVMALAALGVGRGEWARTTRTR